MINKRKKELLCEFVDFTCEFCNKKFDIKELQIHRINREWQGGTYKDFRNLKVLCKEHHKLFHYNEFGNVKGK